MSINWVISDLDGTLLFFNEGKQVINPEVIDKINFLTSKKIKFSIASGRHHEDIANIVKYFGLENVNYYIGCNGSAIYHANSKQIVKSHFLDNKIYTKIISASKLLDTIDLKFVLVGYSKTTDLYIVKNKSLPTNGYNYFKQFEAGFTDYHYIEADNIPDDVEIYEFKLYIDQNNALDIDNVYQKIKKLFKAYQVLITGKYSIEILSQNINKGMAIKELGKMLDNNYVALSIGDSFNDVSMFQATKYSASGSHCLKKVTENATYVAKGNPKKWVNETLDHFFDITKFKSNI